jgi:1-acyl-sn-glycerol-3-phosphate acyltransferase
MSGRSRPGSWWKDPTYRLIVALAGGVFRLLRLRIRATGSEHMPREGGAVLAVSHFSYLDFAFAEWVLMRQRRRYTRYLATKKAFENVLYGWLFRAVGHIPVDREAGARAYAHAVEALHRGEVVGIFPETRVAASFTLLPFKTGAARMAVEAGVPIVPCVVWGGHRVLTRTRRFSLRAALGTPVSVAFGAPIALQSDAETTAATEALHEAMEGLLEQLMDDYPEQPAPGAWWVPAHRGGGAPAPLTQERTA